MQKKKMFFFEKKLDLLRISQIRRYFFEICFDPSTTQKFSVTFTHPKVKVLVKAQEWIIWQKH